jgi:hypothetical protein
MAKKKAATALGAALSSVKRELEDDEDAEEEFVVEAICGARTRKGVPQFEVKWLGFPSSDNTWEPEENLAHCATKLKAFKAAAAKTQPPARTAKAAKKPAAPKKAAAPKKVIAKKAKQAKKKPAAAAAAAATMTPKLVKVPRITNGDDDEQVEAHKAAKATNASRVEAAAEAARLGAAAPGTAHAEIVAGLTTVVRHLSAGASPLEHSQAFVTCRVDPAKGMAEKGSVAVLANKSKHTPTPDGQLLQDLLGDELFGASDLLGSFIGRPGGLAKNMPAFVQAGVREGVIPKAEAARLATLFGGWMKGVSWGKCQLSHTNRPSLGSWEGWPWDAGDPLAQRALSVGLKGKALQVICDWSTPDQIYGEGDPMVQLFIPVWSHENGAITDPAAAVEAAVQAYSKVMTKTKKK